MKLKSSADVAAGMEAHSDKVLWTLSEAYKKAKEEGNADRADQIDVFYMAWKSQFDQFLDMVECWQVDEATDEEG